MKPMKPLLLVAALPLVACQTQPLPEPLDTRALMDGAVAEAKFEFCRGQEPLAAVHPDGTPITIDDLLNAPAWMQGYIAGNNEQWESLCAS